MLFACAICCQSFEHNVCFFRSPVLLFICMRCLLLGTGSVSKMDKFTEKFQTAFDPSPSFLENHIAIFLEFYAQKALIKDPESAT